MKLSSTKDFVRQGTRGIHSEGLSLAYSQTWDYRGCDNPRQQWWDSEQRLHTMLRINKTQSTEAFLHLFMLFSEANTFQGVVPCLGAGASTGEAS